MNTNIYFLRLIWWIMYRNGFAPSCLNLQGIYLRLDGVCSLTAKFWNSVVKSLAASRDTSLKHHGYPLKNVMSHLSQSTYPCIIDLLFTRHFEYQVRNRNGISHWTSILQFVFQLTPLTLSSLSQFSHFISLNECRSHYYPFIPGHLKSLHHLLH